MTTLIELNKGVKAEVIEIAGGFGVQQRLTSLGIKPGKVIVKITTQPMRGPIVVEVDRIRVAIGRGMASKVIIEKIQ